MGLDSYYGSKSLDAIKKEFFNQMSYEELVEKVNETMKVSTRDIDQKWVRENEAKDMIYDEPKKEPLPQFQEMELDKDIQDMLDGMKNGVITPNQTRDEQKAKEANINYINELDDLINSIGSAIDEPKIDSKIEEKIEPKIEQKIEAKITPNIEQKIEPKIEHKTEQKIEAKIKSKIEPKIETKIKVVKKAVKTERKPYIHHSHPKG